MLKKRPRSGLVLLLGAALLLCAGCQKPEWQEHVSEAGGYVALFPGKPEPQTQEVPTATGNFTLHIQIVDMRHTAHAVMYSDMPLIKDLDPKIILEGAKQGLGQQVTYSKSKEITLDGNQGLELHGAYHSGKEKGYHLRVRLYIVKTRLYQVMITSTKEERLSDADAEKFLASFKLK